MVPHEVHTICDRLGYLDRARDLGTESCIAVHSKSLEFSAPRSAGRGGRRGLGGVAEAQRVLCRGKGNEKTRVLIVKRNTEKIRQILGNGRKTDYTT